jgi:hypothetical protein
MIFQSFSQRFQKGLARTIHLSHGLCRQAPGIIPIVVWGPWSRFLEQRKLRELDSGDGVLPGGEGEVGEHEGHEGWARLTPGWPEEGRRR